MPKRQKWIYPKMQRIEELIASASTIASTVDYNFGYKKDSIKDAPQSKKSLIVSEAWHCDRVTE